MQPANGSRYGEESSFLKDNVMIQPYSGHPPHLPFPSDTTPKILN